MQSDRFAGIKSLVSRDPVGAILTIGTKSRNGQPTDRDRFYFKLPTAFNAEFAKKDGGTYQALVRDLHPDFADYNRADPAGRRKINGFIVHADQASAFEVSLAAQLLPKPWPGHPSKAPSCQGDGERARRFFGNYQPAGHPPIGEDGYADIVCPDQACEFRGDKPLCKPRARLLFRLKMDGHPSLLVKFSTQSWHTTSALQGLFDFVNKSAAQLGVKDPLLFGLPFTMALGQKTTERGTFPVLSVTPVGGLMEWLIQQQERREYLLRLQQRPPVAITDGEERAAARADFEDITPPPEGALVPAERLTEVVREREDAKGAALEGLTSGSGGRQRGG